jgi:hypothetical protein
VTNYIKRLEQERWLLREQLTSARKQVAAIEAYLLSDKFHGPENDYVHVRTDMLPKLAALKFELLD